MSGRVEWGVRYQDGVIMQRFNREVAEAALLINPKRALMQRVDGGPWVEVQQRELSADYRMEQK